MLYYNISIYPRAQRDIKRISKYMKEYKGEEILKEIYKDIENLRYMPRIHKTIFYYTKPKLEYRRMISGKYSIIYKIVKDEVIILRIFNQRENYLNKKRFILKENSEKYIIKERRNNSMLKLKTLRNSYANVQENYSRRITGEEFWSKYMDKLIEEAEESLNKEGYITIEELREELIREYNVNI